MNMTQFKKDLIPDPIEIVIMVAFASLIMAFMLFL